MTENRQGFDTVQRFIYLPGDIIRCSLTDGELQMSLDSCFISTAKGEGVVNAGIYDGDMLVFYRTKEVPNGAIAAVFVSGGEVLCRRYLKEGRKIRLRREDGTTPDIVVEKSEAEVLGVMITLIRRFWALPDKTEKREE